MNHKQKLGYTLLGAGIMAVGIIIGQFVTPTLEAQSNGVFDKITCRELEVVDAKGNKAIVLESPVFDFLNPSDKFFLNRISIYNSLTGREAVELASSSYTNNVQVMNHQQDKDHPESFGLRITSGGENNGLFLMNRQGLTAIELNAGLYHRLAIHDYKEIAPSAWEVYSNKFCSKKIRWSRPKDYPFGVGKYFETEW